MNLNDYLIILCDGNAWGISEDVYGVLQMQQIN
jgi:hypothetical protein